jgi:site-specific recombinase
MAWTTDNTGIGAVLKEIQSNTDRNRNSELFISLVEALRRRSISGVADGVSYMGDRLEQEPELRAAFSQMVNSLLGSRDCHSLLTETGVLTGSGFNQQFFRQLKHRILPPLEDKRSLRYLVQKAFYKKSDYKWVMAVPVELWVKLFRSIDVERNTHGAQLRGYLINALVTLSYRLSSLGMEEDINRHFRTDDSIVSPFLEQNNHIQRLVRVIEQDDQQRINTRAAAVNDSLQRCEDMLNTIRQNSSRLGTSLEQSYLLVRAEQQLHRIQYLVNLFTTNDDHELELQRTVQFFIEMVESENKRHNLRDLLSKNIGLLAYQIAEHKGNTGEHYITTNRKEYFKFLYAAAGGGAIISFIAMFKTLLHHVPSAPFWEYFLYGLNYAFGFVLLQITHTTLATKQPAMTASTLASYLDHRKQKSSLQRVVHAFVLVWRSQTAAFAGNLAIVFPLCYLLAYCWELVFGHKLVAGREAWAYLNNQNPLKCPAWLYACFTGVFLFLSGIITGYVDNKVRFSNIAARIREHPLLRRTMRGEKRHKVAEYIDQNLGGLTGNIFLGFALGFAPLIGHIFGIPFDIRHITISTAQFAFGLYGLNNQVPVAELITVIIGVLGIGFFNFLLSFGLAFMVAMRSRGMRVKHYRRLLPLIGRYFLKRPFDFVFPPGKEITHEDVFKKPAAETLST